MRFQPRTPSSGKKNGLMPSTWRRGSARRLAEPHLVERARRESRLISPFGIHGGAPSSVRGAYWRAVARCDARQLVERRVVAARQHRAAEVTRRSPCSRSTRPSSGTRGRRRACAPCSRRRSSARSVSHTIRDVSTGCSRIVASVMTPVRPMPPAVAQNASGVPSGSSVVDAVGGRDDLASARRSRRTSRGGTCRGCRRRSRRRPSRSSCRARPSGTSRAAAARAGACRGSRRLRR